jgi:hypothetical protein
MQELGELAGLIFVQEAHRLLFHKKVNGMFLRSTVVNHY